MLLATVQCQQSRSEHKIVVKFGNSVICMMNKIMPILPKRVEVYSQTDNGMKMYPTRVCVQLFLRKDKPASLSLNRSKLLRKGYHDTSF